MKLSVVIVNYNVRYFLELCLHSVLGAIENLNAEIIVVDNNSEDDSCRMVRDKFPEVILIQNEENLGFSKANNRGVDAATGEYICILNPDTVVAEDTFEALIEFAQAKSNLGIIGCQLIDGTGKFLPESKRNLPVVKIALQKMLGNATNYYANHIAENGTGKVDVLVGAFMFMKRIIYKRLDGFDEDYFMYGEDIDLSYKAIKNGFENYYFGKAKILHFKGESTLKDALYAKRFYGAMQIFYKKHFRSNVVFDFMVWSGIKLASLLRRSPNINISKPSKWFVFSKQLKDKLSSSINDEIKVIYDIGEIEQESVIVFETKKHSFKEIIENIISIKKKSEAKFRIFVNNTNFVIGSDSSSSKGDVLEL